MSYQNYSRAYNISDHTWIYTGGMSNSADYTNDLIQSRKGFVWSKPKNSKLIALFYVGGGSGGGGGCASPTGTAAGGGGGGSTGSPGFIIIPSFMFPDNVRVLPGTGGGGGAGGTTDGITASAGATGSVGTGTLISYIMGDQSTYSAQIVNAPRGNAGGGGASGTGGTGGNSVSITLSYALFGLGSFPSDKVMNVQTGFNGSITTSSTANNTFGYSYSFLAGAGGGGVTTAGAALPGGSVTYGSDLSEYSIIKTTPNATSGANGYTHFSNFLEAFSNFTDGSRINDIVKSIKFISGSGGGGNVGGNGGNGGDGAFGCGGGGGGGAQGTNVSGGTGGKGGPGLVIISSIF